MFRFIGRRLFRTVQQRLSRRGHDTLLVWCLAENTVGCSFYEGLGGERGGERVDTMGGTDVDEVAYVWRDLSAPLIRRRLAADD